MSSLTCALQTTLEHVYRIDGGLDVSHFRVNREVLSAVLGPAADGFRESLLVQDAGEETRLAFFLCDDVERRAGGFVRRPTFSALDAFCVALEGVSHFVYFTFCGEKQDRSVSKVELELQAEIDKFVVLRAVFGVTGRSLHTRLFDDFALSDELTPTERARYRFANRHGRRYARWLDRQFDSGKAAEALAASRQMYRRPLEDKLSFIARPY